MPAIQSSQIDAWFPVRRWAEMMIRTAGMGLKGAADARTIEPAGTSTWPTVTHSERDLVLVIGTADTPSRALHINNSLPLSPVVTDLVYNLKSADFVVSDNEQFRGHSNLSRLYRSGANARFNGPISQTRHPSFGPVRAKGECPVSPDQRRNGTNRNPPNAVTASWSSFDPHCINVGGAFCSIEPTD